MNLDDRFLSGNFIRVIYLRLVLAIYPKFRNRNRRRFLTVWLRIVRV